MSTKGNVGAKCGHPFFIFYADIAQPEFNLCKSMRFCVLLPLCGDSYFRTYDLLSALSRFHLPFRIINTLLWFPSQNRTFSEPKPYVFGTETVRFWFGERKMQLSVCRKSSYLKHKVIAQHTEKTEGLRLTQIILCLKADLCKSVPFCVLYVL